MISVDSLLYGIDQRLNKLATNIHQEIPVEDKIIALNINQDKLVKLKIDVNNVHKLGLDSFKKRYQDLQFLVENFEDHPLDLIFTDKYLNKWITKLDTVSPQYMFYLDSYLLADKKTCQNRVIATVGVENLIIVDSENGLLICSKEDAQHIKKVVTKL